MDRARKEKQEAKKVSSRDEHITIFYICKQNPKLFIMQDESQCFLKYIVAFAATKEDELSLTKYPKEISVSILHSSFPQALEYAQ